MPKRDRDSRDSRGTKLDSDAVRLRGWIDLAVGLALLAVSAITLSITADPLTHDQSSTVRIVCLIALLAGGSTMIRGLWRLMVARPSGAVPLTLEVSSSYKSFVAWRYLLVAHNKVGPTTRLLVGIGFVMTFGFWVLRATFLGLEELGWGNPLLIGELASSAFVFVVLFWGVLRYSKVALIICAIGLGLLSLSILASVLVAYNKVPLLRFSPEQQTVLLQVFNIVAIIGGALAGLAKFFGCLRAFFTFFTTVPIGGVWIGTTALVMVLAVMSGFETDLRDKIVGSNAHLQITREDGDFVEWREVKAKLDRLPGVVASTPYVVSEVVVAANNQGMNVIIKGIDPKTVGLVTDLVSDLVGGQEAMQRLEPIVVETRDLSVPQHPRTGPMIDPPPDDMPSPGEPIDYSGADTAGSGSGSGSGSATANLRHPEKEPGSAGSPDGAAAPAGAPSGGDMGAGIGGEVEPPETGTQLRDQNEPPELFGGDAQKLFDIAPTPRPVVDPPPDDLLTTDEPPADYSRPDYAPDSVVKISEIPFESPSTSRRTQALPGIFVGRELVKQTHLYLGQEVRVVSPLSDPSNPDANGTPIPFNRDYRVAGIFFTGMYEYDLKYVYVTLDSLQSFLDRGDAIDGIEVRLTNPDDTDRFMTTFRAALGSQYRIQDWKEINRSLFSALKLEKIAMFLVLGIVILVASFSIVGNLIMVVVEKGREIALLKTLGASDVGVMQLFAIQGLMIGLIGTALGIATGLAGCWAAKRFGLPLNPDVYYIDKMPIHVDPMSVAAAASAGILISIAATLYPAVVAARVRPAAGMRH